MNLDAEEIFDKLFSAGDPDPARSMAERIACELAEAPKVDGQDRPAIVCHVILRGVPQPLFGSLSYQDGLLKMMTRSRVKHEGQAEREIMLEQFFHVADVTALMFEREVKVDRSRIIVGAS